MIKQLKTIQILKSYDAANFDEMSEAVKKKQLTEKKNHMYAQDQLKGLK